MHIRKDVFIKYNIRLLFCKTHWLLLKNVELVGTFSMKMRYKCIFVASEMGVGVMNWPFYYRWLE